MSTIKFDEMPTGAEKITVENIEKDSVKQAWQPYEAKPEYKEINKHDMIEAMLISKSTES